MGEITGKAVVREVKIVDIRVGDKLLQDIIGHQDRPLIMQGQSIGNREILFLRSIRKHTKPKYSPERYPVGVKTPGAIHSQDGTVLVRAGQTVTEEALAPLIEEGFEVIEGEGDSKIYFRRNEWPENKPWHIDQINPLVRVETTTYIDEAGKDIAAPNKKLAVGDIDKNAPAGRGTAKIAEAAKAKGKPAPAKAATAV